MKILTITEYKKYLAESKYSADDARHVFAGVLGMSIIEQIESLYKLTFNAVEEKDLVLYSMEVKQPNGLIIDRIVYCPTGEYDKYEWWTAASTIEEHMHFPTWNAVVEWFNTKYHTKLPLLNL